MTLQTIVPKYKVEFIDHFGHFYKIEGEDVRLNSVTTINKYAGGPDKTEALMGWSNKVMGQSISEELDIFLGNLTKALQMARDKKIEVDDEFIEGILSEIDIEEIIKKGKGKRKEFLDTASDIGTRMHSAVDEFFVTGNIPKLDDDIQVPFQSFLKWFNTNQYKVIMADTILASKKYRYGGRCDSLLQDKDGNYIVTDFKTSSRINNIEYKLQVAAYKQALVEMYGEQFTPKKGMIIRFDKEKKIFETLEVEDLDKYFEGFLAAMKLKEISESDKK